MVVPYRDGGSRLLRRPQDTKCYSSRMHLLQLREFTRCFRPQMGGPTDPEITFFPVQQLLNKYMSAWHSREARTVADLFCSEAEYYWTPLDKPKRDPSGNWTSVVTSDNQTKKHSIFIFYSCAVQIYGGSTLAYLIHEHCNRKHVELDGIMQAESDRNHKCRNFRQRWQSSE